MKVYLDGIMVTEVVSNKLDRKERNVKEEGTLDRAVCGRFLKGSSRQTMGHRRMGRYLSVVLLLAWDGLLLYMIVECLIAPAYGAAFVAVVSVYLGNKL